MMVDCRVCTLLNYVFYNGSNGNFFLPSTSSSSTNSHFFFCEVKEIPIVIKITTRVINLCVAAFSAGVLRNSNLHKFHVFCFDACFLISFWNAHSYPVAFNLLLSLSLFYFSITFSFVAVVARLNFINQQQSHFSS